MSKERKNCMCTAMLYDPKDHYEPAETKEYFKENSKIYERLLRFKQRIFGGKHGHADQPTPNSTKTKHFSILSFFVG